MENTNVIKNETINTKTKLKSRAKSMGLKSALLFNNKLVLTSFVGQKQVGGKVRSANIEKLTDFKGNEIPSLQEIVNQSLFLADVNESTIHLVRNKRVKNVENKGQDFAKEIDILNPANNKRVGQDYIGLKGEIEQKFFGRKTIEDNVLVQIGYNILDIKKIVSAYIGNVIQIFYNLNRNSVNNFVSSNTFSTSNNNNALVSNINNSTTTNNVKINATNFSTTNTNANNSNNNVNKVKKQNFQDVIGTLTYFKTLSEQESFYAQNPQKDSTFNALKDMLINTNAYGIYFDDVFKFLKNNKNNANQNITKSAEFEHNFNVMRLLSFIRQTCLHGKMGKYSAEDAIFNAKNFLNSTASNQPLLKILDEIYEKGVTKVNDTFAGKNNNGKNKQNDKNVGVGNNLYILNKIFRNWTIEKLVEEYYLFTIVKEQKNIGINLRHLREFIIEDYYANLRSDKYDKCRSKLYKIIDFVLYQTVVDNIDILNEMQQCLRINENGQDGKDKIYKKYAEYFKYKANLEQVISVFDEEMQQDFKNGKNINIKLNGNYVLTPNNTDYFVKIIYFLSKFLDGKEINELYCSLINKFDNIASLIETVSLCNTQIKFQPVYAIFDNCQEISRQLRIAKSISRMKKQPTSFGKQIVADAYYILSLKYVDNNVIVNNQSGNVLNQDKDYANFLNNIVNKKSRSKNLTNFIKNNVLKNKHFFYLIKYTDPRTCGILTKNRQLVEFALRELNESQIRRYYKSLTGNDNDFNAQTAMDLIIDKICNFSLVDVQKNIKNLSEEEYKKPNNALKEQMCKIVTLYLTVIYLIVKNLTKVNTSFAIAFATFERDYHLMFDNNSSNNARNNNKLNYLSLTKKFLDEDEIVFNKILNLTRVNPSMTVEEKRKIRKQRKELVKQMHFDIHSYNYIKNNYDEIIKDKRTYLDGNNQSQTNSFENSINLFRNKVAHLSISHDFTTSATNTNKITSYYSFYCYIMQKIVFETIKDNKKITNLQSKFLQEINKYGEYRMDAMKLLCMPFAYNLSRYKNLSTEALYCKDKDSIINRIKIEQK